MSFEDNIDREYSRLLPWHVQERIPSLQGRVPSMFSIDRDCLYLASIGEFVNSGEDDFEEAERAFWRILERRNQDKAVKSSLPSALLVKYQLALDQQLIVNWIREHFTDRGDARLHDAFDVHDSAT